MKKILKKEVIIAFIVGALIASSVAVYATYSYFANDVKYTKPGTQTEISVEDALNDLYSKINNENSNYASGSFTSVAGINSINIGFTPSKIVFINQNGVACIYNNSISSTNTFTCNNSGVHTIELNSTQNTYSSIISIGTTTNFNAANGNEIWKWFAVADNNSGGEYASGIFTSTAGTNSINIGFTPSKIVFTKQNGVTCVYNYDVNISNSYTCNAYGIRTFAINDNSQGDNTHIISIGATTTLYIVNSNETWHWFALK